MGERQEQRVQMVVPIRVSGTNNRGESFVRMAYTLDTSPTGARLGGISSETVSVGSVISVQYKHHKASFQVVWCGLPDDPHAHQIGAIRLTGSEQMWGQRPEAGHYDDGFDSITEKVQRRPVPHQKVKIRRSERVKVKIPVFVESDGPGIPFSFAAETLVVNAHGCAMSSAQPLPQRTRLVLRKEDGGQSATARVVGCERVGAGKPFWAIGVELDTPGNFWGIKFPPPSWAGSEPASFPGAGIASL